MKTFLVWSLAYFLGAIPFGVLIARSRKINIQEHGSGNIGATNIARTIGAKAGILTLLGDCTKGVVAVAIASATLDNKIDVSVAALLAFLGHLFPVFLKFKGGKGVATGLGIFLYLMPPASLSAMGVFGLAIVVSRYVSIGSILAAISLPVFGVFYKMPSAYIYTSATISALSILKHQKNIQRLLNGTETKLGEK